MSNSFYKPVVGAALVVALCSAVCAAAALRASAAALPQPAATLPSQLDAIRRHIVDAAVDAAAAADAACARTAGYRAMGSAAMAEYLLLVRLDSWSLVQYGHPPRRSLHFQVRSVSLGTRVAESFETTDQRQVGPQAL